MVFKAAQLAVKHGCIHADFIRGFGIAHFDGSARQISTALIALTVAATTAEGDHRLIDSRRGRAMRGIDLIAALILGGCATAKPIFAPDGKMALNVECSGLNKTWADCAQKAGEACGARGYDVIDHNEEVKQPSIYHQDDIGDVAGRNRISRVEMVRCKEPVTAAAS
jgi:hypothetical protein